MANRPIVRPDDVADNIVTVTRTADGRRQLVDRDFVWTRMIFAQNASSIEGKGDFILSSFRSLDGSGLNITGAIRVIQETERAFRAMPEATFRVTGLVVDVPCFLSEDGDYLPLQQSGVEVLNGEQLPEPHVVEERVVWDSTKDPSVNARMTDDLLTMAARPVDPPLVQPAFDFRMAG